MANVGALRGAIRTSNISLVKRLVKGGVCVGERLWYGRTLLQECVTLNDLDMVKTLIEYGEADVNAQNDDGKTALHIASRAGSLDIVSVLLEVGARTDIQCLDGTTSLHLAMWKNKSLVVEKLIKAGANPNLQDQDLWTPLHWGVQNRNLDLVKLLVENGANMDVVNKSLLTPFTLSLENCCFPIAMYMLFMGAGVRTINETKKTPKGIISLLLRPEVVTRDDMDVPRFIMILVENGYNLWHDAALLSGKVMVNNRCEQTRQLLLSQISDPPELLNICRNKVWDLLHHRHAKGKFLETVRSLQIPMHLQSFLLTRAEQQQQMMSKNSIHAKNKSSADLSSGSDLKKTGIIRLKNTSSHVLAGKEMAKLEQDRPSTSNCNINTDTAPPKMVPTRIFFNSPSTSKSDSNKGTPSKKKVPPRIVFDSPSTSKSGNHTDTSSKKVVPTKVVFNSQSLSKCSDRTDTQSQNMVPKRIVFNSASTSKCNDETNNQPPELIPTRVVFNSPSISKCSYHTDSPSKKMVPTRTCVDATDVKSKKFIPTRIVFNSQSRQKHNNHIDTSPKKIIPTRVDNNEMDTQPKKIVPITFDNNHTDTKTKKIVPTRIVINDRLASKCNNRTDTQHNKIVPMRIVLNEQSSSKCNNMDAQTKKMVPERIVFNNLNQTVGDTSLVDCQGRKDFSVRIMNLNQNMSRTQKASPLNDIQTNRCMKGSVKHKTLRRTSTIDASDKILTTDKVRKLNRFKVDITPGNSDPTTADNGAKKWKS